MFPTTPTPHPDTSANSPDRYMSDHVIDGRALLPATALLRFAWQTYANFLEIPVDHLAVQFDDVTIHRPTVLGNGGDVIISFIV